MLAPPVARAGPPTKPLKKRKIKTVAMFLARISGIWKMTKSARPMM